MEIVNQGQKIQKFLSSSDILIASAFSGAYTRLVCQPLDVLKIRLQIKADGQFSLYQSFVSLFKKEGVRGLWKGHNSGQLLSIFYGVGQFGVYGLLSKQRKDPDSKLFTFAIGNLAGLTATVISFPFDVVRTRMVAQGLKIHTYNGIFDALNKIIRNERSALFRGLLPTILAQSPYAGFQFLFYKFFSSIWRDNFGVSNSSILSGSTICGTLAGLSSKLIVFPLDTIKKQMQVSGFSSYTGNVRLLPTVVGLWTSGGIVRFYRGLTPGLIKAMVTSCINLVSFEYCCLAIWKYKQKFS
nr:mitochondrial thiamine pyrophosphate carrier-like isoform X2 [Lepeophtheirus salmonis]XP_040580459.1 mitochondrial thiamine pyrophosphate carrier-like isoform X2 [Lepeophtheirus salmonis]XP_040580460.1 mitochondrial thiamine pyrophosphate carrier-like isoform X2 [Lepeophtheirus salmonis]XP_040580461.1 mitochondrial thiamine pyrophosphate carrier-like isoform X2 [Lepeophtheirus salmonis]